MSFQTASVWWRTYVHGRSWASRATFRGQSTRSAVLLKRRLTLGSVSVSLELARSTKTLWESGLPEGLCASGPAPGMRRARDMLSCKRCFNNINCLCGVCKTVQVEMTLEAGRCRDSDDQGLRVGKGMNFGSGAGRAKFGA
eukprot:15459543-Alexandrium_andersonii.AAC.1